MIIASPWRTSSWVNFAVTGVQRSTTLSSGLNYSHAVRLCIRVTVTRGYPEGRCSRSAKVSHATPVDGAALETREARVASLLRNRALLSELSAGRPSGRVATFGGARRVDTHAEGAVVGGGIAVRRAFRCAGPGGERIRVMRAFAI